ncbi:N-acetylmuramoyl-L-alanine amidase [Novosphingobium sp. Rr 2-17]|uniref:hypothetical protein n=1 Tax=Novosphingobium sp. Rr 2-17 TaxID=555793 RepID=UPI0002699C09|nr:hypothetical protein [Novosphingobium sp. Rr 2-17]EIZ77416.1 N-acetylmuramoyl-L-alanine amidase [Novosphingobium sp. Rr 2-17]
MLLRWISRGAPRFAVCLAILSGAQALPAADFAKSPDHRHVAKIVEIGAGDENGSGSQALVLSDRKSGRERQLFVSKWSDDPHRNLTNLSNPVFSLNGDSLYFSSSDAAPTSGAVHRYDLKNNSVRFVHNGVALRVMRTGPYRGDLLVQVHRYYDRPTGGSYNPVLLVKPNGHDALIVPGSEKDDGEMAIDPWLAQKGWRAW